MDHTSISQRYFIYAASENGHFSGLGSHQIMALFLLAAVFDLRQGGILTMSEGDDPAIEVCAPLPEDMEHLRPLYQQLCKPLDISLSRLTRQYFHQMSFSLLQELIDAVGVSLVLKDAASPKLGGVFGKRLHYVPSTAAVYQVISAITTELIDSPDFTAPTREIIILTALLRRANLLADYFSDEEQTVLAQKIRAHLPAEIEAQAKRVLTEVYRSIL